MISKLQYISQGDSPKDHLDNITNACRSGADWVQLRLKNLEYETLLKTAEKAREITNHYQARFILNDHYKIAKVVNADGVHLGKTDACPIEARKHLYSWQLVGGTANTSQDCKKLIGKDVDYIGLGPFRFTNTKHNLSPILGLNGYINLLQSLRIEIPIIAIGGITLNDVSVIIKTGVYGIAVSQEITQDFNQIKSFQKLLGISKLQEDLWNTNQNSI
ncbi:thiamine phosphate synthase [Gelidibacter salicanalis]|uniref:Thiamine-phosphate synthase n=1 Tax=Gelidibacter salicanalis TaxID=291193 RepID=A0A934KQH8_9FLAO|nr:thiamine phosphate synthase [Gelidibacter salicanalis]MBJ7881974.1 thiamine phosphate synthase [Gelidibacter salicanalis]